MSAIESKTTKFGGSVRLWRLISRRPEWYLKNQKLHLQPVASYWQIATLLTNCHSCFYGNQTATYFGVPTPEVEDLLKNGL